MLTKEEKDRRIQFAIDKRMDDILSKSEGIFFPDSMDKTKIRETKRVLAFKDGEFLELYGSTQRAANDLGMSAWTISKILTGKTESCKGYTFKYA